MIDTEILTETYTVIKEYIPAKDRQTAAEHLFGVLTDLDIMEKDLKIFCQSDPYLQRAFEEYFEDEQDDDEVFDYDQDD